MPSRSVRRRKHKEIGRVAAQPEPRRREAGASHLLRWRAEASRRADDLGAPAAWALADEARPAALALDPSGELLNELDRLIAEAVAAVAGRHLVRGSRPLADRGRAEHAAPAR